MALGELTKQIAQQALLSATEKPAAPPPAAPAAAENVGATILGQIAAMQKALKEDEELLMTFQNGAERIRVHEIFLPSWRVAVLTGTDPERNMTRVISPVEVLQLVTKTVKAAPGTKPLRIGLISQRPKEQPSK
jgi:hypothetical protein